MGLNGIVLILSFIKVRWYFRHTTFISTNVPCVHNVGHLSFGTILTLDLWTYYCNGIECAHWNLTFLFFSAFPHLGRVLSHVHMTVIHLSIFLNSWFREKERNQQINNVATVYSPFPVGLIYMGDLWYQRVVGIWITKKRADRQ